MPIRTDGFLNYRWPLATGRFSFFRLGRETISMRRSCFGIAGLVLALSLGWLRRFRG